MEEMTMKRTCRVCGCDISDLHINCLLCKKKACKDVTKRMYYETERGKTASLHIRRYKVDKKKTDSYAAGIVLCSPPPATVGGGRARGHAGTNYNPADQVEARKSALDWLLKGRKLERMNPAKIKVNVRPKSWRESHAEGLAAVRKSGVVA